MLQTVICGPDFKLLAKVIMVYSLRRHFAEKTLLSLLLTLVTKTEFLLKLSIQYQADKIRDYQSVDY